jgi:hypothetical protein
MKKKFILWSGAILITFLAGYLHSVSDKYYPVTGTIGIEGEKTSFKFDKVHREDGSYKILVRTEKKGVSGEVLWRRLEAEEWKRLPLINEGTNLYALIPDMEAEAEILYKVVLNYNEKKYSLPGPVKLIYYGKVHPIVNFLFYFTLFGALLLSVRTGLEYFNPVPKVGTYTIFTTIFFFLFTIAVNPLKLSYELEAINQKVLPITRLFTIQSLSLLSLWILAMIIIFSSRKRSKIAALIFSILTIIIYLLIR